jgi:hypothetical protein
MFAVVYKNRVLVGPMGWNRGIFQGSLEKEKIITILPRVAPQQLPYIVNNDAKIMVVFENRPEINPMVEYYYGPLWEINDDNVVANYEVNDIAIGAARNNFKTLAAEERWKKEITGTKINIQDTEVTIETDRETRNIFVQKYSIMGENETVNWKFPERWLVLTKSELGQVIGAGATYIQSCFDWEKSISDQIDFATTKEELLQIQIKETEQNADITD